LAETMPQRSAACRIQAARSEMPVTLSRLRAQYRQNRLDRRV
jgi:hypothetical protein